jgi:hypothetical protein
LPSFGGHGTTRVAPSPRACMRRFQGAHHRSRGHVLCRIAHGLTHVDRRVRIARLCRVGGHTTAARDLTCRVMPVQPAQGAAWWLPGWRSSINPRARLPPTAVARGWSWQPKSSMINVRAIGERQRALRWVLQAVTKTGSRGTPTFHRSARTRVGWAIRYTSSSRVVRADAAVGQL